MLQGKRKLCRFSKEKEPCSASSGPCAVLRPQWRCGGALCQWDPANGGRTRGPDPDPHPLSSRCGCRQAALNSISRSTRQNTKLLSSFSLPHQAIHCLARLSGEDRLPNEPWPTESASCLALNDVLNLDSALILFPTFPQPNGVPLSTSRLVGPAGQAILGLRTMSSAVRYHARFSSRAQQMEQDSP